MSEPKSDHDPVAAYYEEKRLAYAATYKALQEARKRSAPPEEIRRLEKRLELDAYVGD